ncbi:MAG: rhodanese-like domain-containing protein [Sulfurovaceae bacterium]|nr:rhodanese-like domain-containing protein [Sulfurovaceae bacterium]
MKRVASVVLMSSVLAVSSLYGAPIQLIEPAEAIKLIGNKNVVFVSGDDEDAFTNGHILGSVDMFAHHLHHSDIMGNMECAPLYQCPKDAQELIRSKGIKNDQMIIAYDNHRGPNATGVYSFFESFGHKNLKLLNGGYDGIKEVDPNQQKYDALKKERKAAKKAHQKDKEEALSAQMDALKPKLLVQPGEEGKHTPSNYVIDPKNLNTKYIADKQEVKKAVDDILKNGDKSKFVVIDARSMDEIIGEKKMDNVARGGHIPGAKLIEWKNITDEEKVRPFKSNAELQKLFDKTGVRKNQTIYAYCQVGAGRGSHIISALRNLGYQNVKVFTGSWDAWGNDMNLPIRR